MAELFEAVERGRDGGLGLKEAVWSTVAAGVVFAWWRGGGSGVEDGRTVEAEDGTLDDIAVDRFVF